MKAKVVSCVAWIVLHVSPSPHSITAEPPSSASAQPVLRSTGAAEGPAVTNEEVGSRARRLSVSSGNGEIVMSLDWLEASVGAMYDDLAVLPDPNYGGMILMWSGSTNTIPAGWVLCDGANGTPDLRDRFVQGATGAGTVGDVGGITNHTHTAAGHQHPYRTPSHTHGVEAMGEEIWTEESGKHTHILGGPTGGSIHVYQFGLGGEPVASVDHSHVMFDSWNHRHGLNLAAYSTGHSEGTNRTASADSPVEATTHVPPFHGLAYIMKLPEKETPADPPTGLDLGGRVSALKQKTTNLTANLKTTATNTLPAGLIALWSGITDPVPETWVACEGASGTPDLRDRFVLGASGSSDVGDAGGAIDHRHTTHAHSHRVVMPSHSHALPSVELTTESIGDHTHTLGPASGGWLSDPSSDFYDRAILESHTHTTTSAGAHAHQLTLPSMISAAESSTTWTGLTDSTLGSQRHLPPFHKLRFLMKRAATAVTLSPNLAPPGSALATRVDALEKAMAKAEAVANRAVLYSIPTGTIAVWSAGQESIPAGWIRCDGRYGTPDLRGRFVRAASHDAGTTGGSATHNHGLGSHQHTSPFAHTHAPRPRNLRTLTVLDREHWDYHPTSHTHSMQYFTDSVESQLNGTSTRIADWLHSHRPLTGGEEHEHDVVVSQPLTPATEALLGISTEETYASYEAENLPPYRKLIFIMKTAPGSLIPRDVLSSATAAIGETLAVTATLGNLSSSLTQGTRIGRVYLSKDADYSPYSDRVLGEVLFNSAAAAGGSLNLTNELNIPNVPPGDYYIIIQVDRDKMTAGTTATNIFRTQAIQVRVPDLTPTALSAPASVAVGESLTAVWTVRNAGDAEAKPTWQDRLYLSPTAAFNSGSARYLGNVDHELALAPDGTYDAQLKFSMPSVPPGEYYLIVRLDYYDRVYEASEANQYRSLPIQVRVPELVPVSLEAPAVVDVGQSLTATWSVSNGGNADAQPSWQDRLYLSPTAAFNSSSARYLGSVDHEIALAPEGSYDAQLVFSMPNVPPGEYHLIARLDYYDRVYEASEANQYRSTPIQIRVPDLTPVALAAPEVVDAGQALTANWTVANAGNAGAQPSWRDRLYLSTDDTFSSGSDRYLGDVAHENLLAPGARYSSVLQFTLPNVAPGDYFLILQVDHYDSVYESVKTNQTRSLPIQIRVPDLVPTKLAAPSEATVGQSLTATWTVENAGNAEARGPWRDRVYLSTDAVLSTSSDRYLGDVTHESALGAGDAYVASLKFTLPNVPAGSYYLVVQVDHYDSVYESDEKNNVRAQTFGPEPAKPILTTLASKGSLKRGTQINLTPPPAAQRVEVSVNGNLVGTVYGGASAAGGTTSVDMGPGIMSSGTNRVQVEAFDDVNRRVGSATSVVEDWQRSTITELRLEEPGSHHTLYTDDLATGADTLLMRAYAAYLHVWTRPITGGHGWVSGEEWVPLTNGQFQVKFYVDSVLVHTSTNPIPSDPFIHEFTYHAASLTEGEHRVSVALRPPDGYRTATDAAILTVEPRHPELQINREVVPAGNHFDVTLTLRNRGSAAAAMQWLKEPMVGFQACCAGGTLVASETRWSFDPASRQGIYRFDLGGSTIPAGTNATLTYKAVPVLFRTSCDPVFGGEAGEYAFANAGAADTVEPWRTTTTRTSPWEQRRVLADAVADAGHGSDYLLMTDPINLNSAFGEAGLGNVLTNMAELATLRNGVLGYYHTYGSIDTSYRAGDAVATGRVFNEGYGKENLFIASRPNDRVYCYSDSGQLTIGGHQLPIEIELGDWDALAVGNVMHSSTTANGTHLRDEIVVGWAQGHSGEEAGRIYVYQYERRDEGEFGRYALQASASEDVAFHAGDKLATGNVTDDPTYSSGDEIIVARGSGNVDLYSGGGWRVTGFESKYRPGDFFAAGDLLGAYSRAEIVVGDVAWNIKIYVDTSGVEIGTPTYEEAYRIPFILTPQDGMAIGDVLGDAYEEIIVADQSEGRLLIYAYDPAADDFREAARFTMDYHEDDELSCGYLVSDEKEQILILRGHGVEGRREGTVDIISHLEGATPGDRWALDRLINVGGSWANALTNNWTSEGHLLIVGENEIIPAFTKYWSVDDWEGGGRVDYTDRDYASTGADDNENTPELAVGRIVGNSGNRVSTALRHAIEVAREPWRLGNGRALCLSGPNPGDNDKFIAERESIAATLSTHGFDVREKHLPNDNYFFTNEQGRDVFFLAGHGNTGVWGDCLTSSNVFHHFVPGTTRPLIYAASCLTGRYPASEGTLSEQFLYTGASIYIGATELTYSWGTHGRGWCPRLAEAFFGRIQADRTVGQSLKLAKRARLSSAASTYASDWNKNRYHSAVYHLYGDPKTQFSWTNAALRLASVTPKAIGLSEPVAGPLTQYSMAVPMFVTGVGQASDDVDIPGGEWLGVTGKPGVPFYVTNIRFPKGQVVQSVALKQRSAPLITPGLRLPPVVPDTNAPGSVALAPAPASGWWPDQDFAWSQTENPDGSRDLSLKAMAFVYNSDTAEARFYSNYVFEIRWTTSAVNVTGLTTDRRVYSPGTVVKADLTVDNAGGQPIDAVAEIRVFTNEHDLVSQLPSIAMPSLKALGWATIQWDTAQALGGDYALEVLVRDVAGNELDRARTEFQVGSAAGAITRFEVQPKTYAVGDDVTLAGTFSNTGTTSLDGSVVIVVQDPAGNSVTEFTRPFSAVAAGGAFRFDTVWSKASLGPGQCQFLVYAQFGGQTTALSVYANDAVQALLWETVAIGESKVELTWSGEAGHTYAVDFTPDLVAIPFTCIASNLPAMTPRNVFVDDVVLTKGFYRLRQEAP